MKLYKIIGAALILLSDSQNKVTGFKPGSDIQEVERYELLSQGKYGSSLYKIIAPNSSYDDAPLLIDLRGPDSYSQGYEMGFLLGHEFLQNYENLMTRLLGNHWWEPRVQALFDDFINEQWDDYLSKQVPQSYLDEFKGLTDGGLQNPLNTKGGDVGKVAQRAALLANLPGTLTHFTYILEDEKKNPVSKLRKHGISNEKAKEILDLLESNWSGFQCSNFGVWGSRTEDSRLFTGRNLDWLSDSGISTYKLITVHHPPDGHTHATIGWAALWGANTGMSSQGITVHQADLESNDITFRGFPFVLRLREVMAKTKNLEEAINLWNSTNNTVGFNHGFGSANDQKAVLLETMMGNTAYFYDNDVREQSQVIYDGRQIGAPRKDAVYRTNHGYDQYTISHFMRNHTIKFNDSIQRYLAFPEAFDSYEAANKKITHIEAVNITAVLAEKGKDKYNCNGYPYKGHNILSVAYDPSNLMMYTAWENGRADKWSPGACNTYLAIDMKIWFKDDLESKFIQN